MLGGSTGILDVRFARSGDDLLLDVADRDSQILLQDWYSSVVDRIDEITLSNGATVVKQQVDALVDTWSQYDAGTIDIFSLGARVHDAWSEIHNAV